MADHAGFAAALTIREHLLDDALLLAYAGDGFPRSLTASLPEGPPDADIDVFLGPPRVTCNADNSLSLALRLWGALSVTLSGVEHERMIDGRLEIRIRPRFVVSGTHLALSPEPEDITVSQWQFTTISGGAFPPDADLYLRSAFFRDRLQAAIRFAVAFGLVELPEVDVAFLGSVLAVVNVNAAARARDGVLLIGLDIESDDVTIVGDIDLLQDFARSNDLAAATNAAAVPILMQDIEAKVRDEVAKHGATLERLTISAEAGRFLVEGAASKSTGTANFSFAVVPAMFHTTPGAYFQYLERPVLVHARVWPALEFSTADVEVDVDRATWVVLVEILGAFLTGVVVPLIIEDMVGAVAGQFRAAVATADTGAPVPRVRRLKPTEPGGATVRIEIAEYEITTAGTYIGITVEPEKPVGALVGLTSIPEELRSTTLRYAVVLPLEARPDDPALRVRWTVIDLASGNVLRNEDDVAAGRLRFEFEPSVFGSGVSRLGVGCRVYRALGPEIVDLVNDGITLDVRGPLGPGGYVRWRYAVKNPQVQFDEANEAWAYAGEAVRNRWSNLHRTDHPCAMVSQKSRYAAQQTEILDALPFPVRDILRRRAQLCDYCFYGGPAGMRPSL